MIDTTRTAFPTDMQRASRPGPGGIEEMASGLVDSLRDYAREKPGSAVLWALGIGFLLGWKLKP